MKGTKLLPPPLVTDNFGVCFQKLRKQSDLQLIRCVQVNNIYTEQSYIMHDLQTLFLILQINEQTVEFRITVHPSAVISLNHHCQV